MHLTRHTWTIAIIAAGICLIGCRPGEDVSKDNPVQKTTTTVQQKSAPKADAKQPSAPHEKKRIPLPEFPKTLPPRRSLGEVLQTPADAVDRWMPDVQAIKIDDALATAEGIRRLDSRHLTLYTDMPSSPATDALPAVFDQAFPQWCEYFGIDPKEKADWHQTGFLMRDPDRFRQAGLLPKSLPPFQHGFSRNTEFWLYEQASDYFTRHLVLHEGTHGFMNTVLGASGPPWFMEGLAELLGTHRWKDGRLKMDWMPQRREDVPMWGRLKLIKDDRAAGQAKSLRQVLDTPFYAYLEKNPYAWSWAAALFLDRHPRYAVQFRRLRDDVLRPDLTERFVAAVGDDWPALERQWQIFLTDLEYGSDVARIVPEMVRGKPITPSGNRVEVSAERGWQNSGLWLQKDTPYRFTAQGRYQVAREPKIWWCEPGGVTIHYYRGRPLGMLLAIIVPEVTERPLHSENGTVPFQGEPLKPIPVGLGATVMPEVSGTLYFKINESSADWGDNAGGLSVEIRPE